ncbi:unnamed protein product [Adineta ricciae]|uniref:G-protein coupled receptors family 1 profile domain-containing protein n=1 Tax=Adineta ricciae TaxID=249248 RepID=A0A814MCI0_ADIRI|nr:unnamed protein product [Adineta ricciae]CAF1182033.1 unnamed protein product [Adineta ricciae]
MNFVSVNLSDTNSSTSISPALLQAPAQLNIYLGIFIFITGNISTIGNFLVFSSRLFRARACSNYLIVEPFFTLLYFNFVLVTRVIQKGFLLPIIDRYNSICKIRQFLSEYTHQVAFTLFALATIDRFLSTHHSNSYRVWSNRFSLTYKLIPAVIIFWFLCTFHRLIFYSNSTGSCGPLSVGIYVPFDAYFEVIMSGVVPPILFITLGCLLLRNVRIVARRRVAVAGVPPTTSTKNSLQIQQIDSQLSVMITLQSFVAIPSFLPFGAQNLYSSITRYWPKSPLYAAWENIIIETIRLFSYLFYSTSFYVCLISSRGFRKQALDSFGIKRYNKTLVAQTNATN